MTRTASVVAAAKPSLQSVQKDVPLANMHICAPAQRDLNSARVDLLAAEFDLAMFGFPVVSFRDGRYYIVDGHHRIEALKKWLGDWDRQSVTCRVYAGLSERGEADMFDRLNNVLAVKAFDKFRVRVSAGRPTESAVKHIVEGVGLKIASDSGDGSVSAVSTLVRIYARNGGPTLARSLGLINNSFGRSGLVTPVMDGMARVCGRYNGQLDDAEAVEHLRDLRGGIGQLMARANLLRNQTHQAISECVAAAVVDVINKKKKRGTTRLPSWWKE